MKSKTSKTIKKAPKVTKPTVQEIAEEIVKLFRLKPKIPATSMFGDDNRATIDAEITTLQHDLDESECYNKFCPTDVTDEIDESIAHDIDRDEGRSDDILSAALNALRWKNEGGEPPSEGWANLVK